ncbi:DUF4150 domain-containing protein [Rhizobium leguminosarum]|uniref:DUF4150 domain-containing protein n=2 Tax=Rhizobium leguminosarum TaxID=384 RepID=UPI003F9A934B
MGGLMGERRFPDPIYDADFAAQYGLPAGTRIIGPPISGTLLTKTPDGRSPLIAYDGPWPPPKREENKEEKPPELPAPAAASPAPPEIIHDNSEALAVCLSPDVCRSPKVPVPYMSYGTANNDFNYATNVFSNGLMVKHHQSKFSCCFGDEPGTGLGCCSNTVGDVVEPVTSSEIVYVNGIPVQRHGDLCTLNKGNTVGEYCYVRSTDLDKPPPAEDNQDKAWYEKAWDWTGEKLNETGQAIHEFDQSHGKVITRGVGALQAIGGAAETIAGAGLAGVGTGASATGVGAVPGVPAMIAGGALAVNGYDNFSTGLRQLWTGEQQNTAIAQAAGQIAGAMGASPETVQNVTNTTNLIQGVAGGAGAIAATAQTSGRTLLVTGVQGARSTALPRNIVNLEQRLIQHLRTAQQRARLTPRQAAAVARNPNQYNTHMGTQIDTVFKNLVDNDPSLRGLVTTTPRFQFGPDVVVNGQNYWFDVTTAPQWQAHVTKYTSGFGTGVPLIWP